MKGIRRFELHQHLNEINMKKNIKKILLILLIFFCFTQKNVYAQGIELNGSGTFNDPYLINTANDLKVLEKAVNTGNDFADCYFKQTKDIDLKKHPWTPIGNKKNIFKGTYDGNGYEIENINTDDSIKKAGFFGNLAGTVANLGIKSGTISGKYSGTIASCAVGENAKIVNCYSSAKVKGERAGGIADSFSMGTIANCWSTGDVEGESVGGIVSSGGDVKLYNCYTFNDILAPGDAYSSTSYCVNEDYLFTNVFSLKFSLFSALSQYLFLDNPDLTLLQWKNVKGGLEFDHVNGFFSKIVGVINYWLLTLLLIIMSIVFIIMARKEGVTNYVKSHKNNLMAETLIGGVVAFFVDAALITKHVNNVHVGNGLFIVLINLFVLILGSLLLIDYTKKNAFGKFKKEWIPLLLLIVVVVGIEITQFGVVPKYDASLYYGSFVKAAKIFRLDLLSYIGAFVCWKWAQGLALFMGPFEFLFPGESVSIYLANLVITIITLICLYWLLDKIYIEISNWAKVLTCTIFIFSPYVLGLYTYMCMDWQLAFFIIWLLCAIKKENDVMISFCGFLLAFTKITGLIAYVLILFLYVVVEILAKSKIETLWKNIVQWWNWKRVILWISPAVLFGLTLRWGDHLTIQNFYGSYVSDGMIEFGNKTRILNNLVQTYIFGFRWVFTILLLLAIAKIIIHKHNMCSITEQSRNLLLALCIAFVGVTLLLCIYNSDAECPRYTAIFSAFFAIMFPFEISNLFKSDTKKKVAYIIMATILIIQTFWTIDPVICMYAKSVDTGRKQIYRLGINNDDRFGMNLGTDYGLGYPIICDLYSYNLEYSFYDDLLQSAFAKMNLENNDTIYVLDIYEYELHISGSANRNYKIYWDSDKQKRTYKKNGNIYLNAESITTEEIINSDVKLPDKFYIVAVARVDESQVLKYLSSKGYMIKKQVHPKNLYGSISMYEIKNGKNYE